VKNAKDELDTITSELLDIATNALSMLCHYKHHGPFRSLVARLDRLGKSSARQYRLITLRAIGLTIEMNHEQGARSGEIVRLARTGMQVAGPEDEQYYLFALCEASTFQKDGDRDSAIDAIRGALTEGMRVGATRESLLPLLRLVWRRRSEWAGDLDRLREPLEACAGMYCDMDQAAFQLLWSRGPEHVLQGLFKVEGGE
jgi:hypothetical protein